MRLLICISIGATNYLNDHQTKSVQELVNRFGLKKDYFSLAILIPICEGCFCMY